MAAITLPEESAIESGLHYLLDAEPGLTRRRCGKGFTYRRADGRPASAADRARAKSLVIPPAWTDVWISPDPLGHLQVTGRDDRGRKQYLYHDDWRVARDQDKFDHLAGFGRALPQVRSGIQVDLRRRGLAHRKVLAVLVNLLDTTLMRIGNEQYAEENESYGLTTLRPEHVEISGTTVSFCFVGKSGAEQSVAVRDQRVATLVRRCREAGGEQLFVSDNAGDLQTVCSDHVNEYLRELGGDHLTARDFRTWGATVKAAAVLGPLQPPDDEKTADADHLTAIDTAADSLGNTRAVCRASYVHPGILDAHTSGELAAAWKKSRGTKSLTRPERTVLAIIEP